MLGKVLGGMIGLGVGLLAQGWIAALVLAAVGIFLGHRYDELHTAPEDLLDGAPTPMTDSFAERDSTGRRDTRPSAVGALPAPLTRAEVDATARAHFARHLCALFAEVARSDGEIVRDEVRVVREFFEHELRSGPRELELVRTSLKAALANPVDLDAALRECAGELSSSEHLLLLNALYELALADSELRRSEQEAIRRIANGLGISKADQRSVAALHLGDADAHYEVLGLDPDASDEEVRSAFRRLAAEHHPDKVAHLGEGAAELASRRFREIKEAWDEIRKRRGL